MCRIIPGFLMLCISLNLVAFDNQSQLLSNASFSIATVEAEPGDYIDAAVTTTGFVNIMVFEIRITFNRHVLSGSSGPAYIKNIHPALGNVLYNLVNDSTIALGRYGAIPLNVPDGEKLFDLHLLFCSDALNCALNGSASPLTFIESQTYMMQQGNVILPLNLYNGVVYTNNPLYALVISQTGAGHVMINGSTYTEPTVVDPGNNITLEALPAEGYLFENWTDPDGNVVSDQPEYSFTMPDQNVFLTANFIEIPPDVYVLSFNIINEFSASVDDAVIVVNGQSFEPGNYVVTDLEPGTYSYDVEHDCYNDLAGAITIHDSDVTVDIVLTSVPGDANGDGLVNVLDIINMVNYYVGSQHGSFCFYNADVNHDGVINVLDIIMVVDIFSETE